ncbi:MAG: hypothetical protein P4L40_05310, partial [Terracidiphilus sp.]|nr:hypothetical protein [Terracidiphilus sp.]
MRSPLDPVEVYTDGSFDSRTNTSSWSVVFGDEWLDSNFASVPCNEASVRPADVGGATLIGANITCTRGIYPAELQAIVRTLAMVPLSISLHIHTDSQASMAAIHSFHKQRNERKGMRMPARTILQLIESRSAVTELLLLLLLLSVNVVVVEGGSTRSCIRSERT